MSEPWYHEGLRFECSECGACCRRAGDVELSAPEALAIAREFDGPMATVEALLGELWVERWDGVLVIRVPEGSQCPLLDERGRCSVHRVKPLQCRTYPFWPENVASPSSWRVEGAWCEGIGRGPLFCSDDVARILNTQPPPDFSGEGR